jgi:hypothetical protein
MSKDAAEIVMVVEYDGEPRIEVVTVRGLAQTLRDRVYADIDVQVTQVQALGRGGLLTDVFYAVSGLEYNENGMAYPTVTVTFPDGHTESAVYAVDGNG